MSAFKISRFAHEESGKALLTIDFSKSHLLMEKKFEQYNLQQSKACDKIKMPHIFLAKELIRLYRAMFRRWHNTDRKLETVKDMPLLSVNNKFLGQITGRTDRSIRNYRKVLQKAGFFLPVAYDDQEMPVYEIHHGRQADFEVLINPEFLYIETAKTKVKLRLATSPLSVATRKNFPPTSTSTVQEQQEQQELVGGKSCAFAEKFEQEQQEPGSGEANASIVHQQEQQEPMDKNEPRKFGHTSQKTGTKIPAGGGEVDPYRARKVRGFSKKLLNGVRTYLYPAEAWPKDYRILVLQTIDRLFGDKPEELFPRIASNYYERMKLVQLHWHKEFGELPEPHVFFNPENPNGFRITKNWPNNPEKYPPPARKTYRYAQQRRANGRRGTGLVTLADLI